MLDYGMLPPEINSARMYAGAGSGPMMAAAAAWLLLANGLESTSRGYAAVIARLQGAGWSGGASDAMADAIAPYVTWMINAEAQAEEAASQARAAATAYEAAFCATVPPPVVTANRTQLAQLVATNVFGQNTAMIGATEADYQGMWAQDAAAMYGYAASSSAATRLTQFSQPAQTTSAAGTSSQAAAVAQAVGTSTAGNSQTTLSQLMAAVPQQLQTLASGAATDPSAAATPVLTGFSSFNTLTAPINLGDGISRTITSGGSFGTGVLRSNIQSAEDAAKAAGGAAAKAASSTASVGVPGPVLASAGNAPTVGKLTVPQSWATTNPVVSLSAEQHWLSDTELDGPSWHEGPPATMLNGVPAGGARGSSGLLSRPTINNLLRVTPRQFKMPRPSSGG
jgi:PPE-repeat protein